MPIAKKLSLLDEMRVIAWFKETLAVADCKNALEFAKISLDAEGTAREFRLYEKGGRLPSPETLAMVDARFDSPCSRTFLVGPDGCPLWDVLRGDLDACRQAIELCLGTLIHTVYRTDPLTKIRNTLDNQIASISKLLGVKEEMDFICAGPEFGYVYLSPPPDPTSTDNYYLTDNGKPSPPTKPTQSVRFFKSDGFISATLDLDERSSLSESDERAAFVEMAVKNERVASLRNYAGPLPAFKTPIGPDVLAGVFALRTLAVMREEMLRETHFLVSFVRQGITDAIDFWGISKQLTEYTAEPQQLVHYPY